MSSLRSVLRVELSESIDADALSELHRTTDPSSLKGSLAVLFRELSVERFSPVYTVSEEEVRDGTQFAREFQIFLIEGAGDPAEAIRALESSEWVNTASPLTLSHSS